MPKKLFIKTLLDRRIPQILGSYLVAGTSLILFIEYLIDKYQFPSHYPTLGLFALIGILPSVVILAYFHGAPGKDDWTKVEKVGIPINVLFIAGILFFGDSLNFWTYKDKDPEPDTFLINISNIPNLFKWIDEYNKIDSLKKLPELRTVSDSSLDEIKNHVISFIETKFFNLGLSLHYSNRATEKLLKEELPPAIISTEFLFKEERDKIRDDIKQIYKKENIYLDGIINLFLYGKKPSGETSWGKMCDIVYLNIDQRDPYISFIQFKINETNINEEIAQTLYKYIHQLRFGDDYLGEVIEIVDNNLIKIKMVNSNIYKGVKVNMGRLYSITKDSYVEERQTWLDDINYIYDFFINNAELQIKYEKIYKENKALKDSLIKNLTEILKEDSLGVINGSSHWDDDNNDYYGEIISITDDEAIIKVDRFEYPFGKIKLGDEVILYDAYNR